MKNSGKLVSFLVPIISILLAFVIGCIIMAVLGANPFVALESLWIGAFGSLRNVGTTLARSTPLIFTSLCACFAYRCGVFNLGGEGQFLMGSIVCCYIATQSGIEGLPAILLCLVGGAVAGGLWSLISGLLKVYRGQNEMIITIMLNYVATLFMGVVYTDWLRDGSVPQTQAVPEATQLSRLFGLRVTSAFVIALAVSQLYSYLVGIFSHWEAIHQSSSFSTIFDRSGERMPPCGVPFTGCSTVPSGMTIGAFNISRMMHNSFLSRIPICQICCINFVWLTLSKKPLMSTSTTKYNFCRFIIL